MIPLSHAAIAQYGWTLAHVCKELGMIAGCTFLAILCIQRNLENSPGSVKKHLLMDIQSSVGRRLMLS